MKRKGICIIVIIPVVMILALIYAFLIKNALEKQTYDKNYLAPFPDKTAVKLRKNIRKEILLLARNLENSIFGGKQVKKSAVYTLP